MDARFLESWINREHVVLGRRLHAYCLYDLLFLLIDGNPLAIQQEGFPASLEDLQAAVLICSTPPETYLNAQPVFRWKWLRRLWNRRVKQYNLVEELAKWVQYVKDFDARPKFWESEDGEVLRAPWIISVSSFIEDHSNMSNREIMTAPLGQMLWKSAALSEQLGLSSADILTEEDEEVLNQLGLSAT